MFVLCENVRPKVLNLGLQTHILEKSKSNIEILSTHNLLCRKFAVSVEKLASLDVRSKRKSVDTQNLHTYKINANNKLM